MPAQTLPVGLLQRELEVWGQHGDQDGYPHLLTEHLVEISRQCQDLGFHLSMWVATSSSPFALPGLMAAIMSCMPLIGVVEQYLLESFLHASSPLNPLVCSIWRGSPLTGVPRMLRIPELKNLSASDSDKTSPISFSFSAVLIKWYAASYLRDLDLVLPQTPMKMCWERS